MHRTITEQFHLRLTQEIIWTGYVCIVLEISYSIEQYLHQPGRSDVAQDELFVTHTQHIFSAMPFVDRSEIKCSTSIPFYIRGVY